MKPFVPEAAEKNLEEMLNDCSIDAIIAIDNNQNIVAWNAMAGQLYGKSRPEAVGKPLTEVIASIQEDPETINAIRFALKGIKSFVPASNKFSHRRHKENHFIPLQDENGIVGVMNLVHNVAHRIKAEEQLKKLNEELETRFDQLKATADELANYTFITSNQVKEPIRHTYLTIENIIKQDAAYLSNHSKAAFRRMQSSLNRMDLLLNDVLRLAKISILERSETPVDLKSIFEQIVTELDDKLAEKGARVELLSSAVIPGHREYLYMLFLGLVDNAVKFNESRSPVVQVSCDHIAIDTDKNEAEEKQHYCRVTISDNGIGIDEGDTDRIFSMFEKLNDKKYKGTGMGLTIAKKIMNAHGGFILVESKKDSGSSFICYFPVEETTAI